MVILSVFFLNYLFLHYYSINIKSDTSKWEKNFEILDTDKGKRILIKNPIYKFR